MNVGELFLSRPSCWLTIEDLQGHELNVLATSLANRSVWTATHRYITFGERNGVYLLSGSDDVEDELGLRDIAKLDQIDLLRKSAKPTGIHVFN